MPKSFGKGSEELLREVWYLVAHTIQEAQPNVFFVSDLPLQVFLQV